MPKKSPKAGYTLKDSSFFRLRSRKQLADLLHVTPATLAAVAIDESLYSRRWKHKTLKDGQPGAWLRVEPTGEQAEIYRPIDIPDPRLKAMQSRIADLLEPVRHRVE